METNRFKLDFETLKGGISVKLRTPFKRLQQVCDPWRFFSAIGIQNALSMFALIEQSTHSDAKNNMLRERSINYPGIGPTTKISNVESQRILNTNSTTPTEDRVRQRDKFIVVFTPLIWIAGHVYAFDDIWRLRFSTAVKNFQHIPVFMSELMKRTRNCDNMTYRIVTGVYLATWDLFVISHPEYKNTFWDPRFLMSESGLTSFIGFLSYLYNAEGNYIPFVEANDQSVPPHESGTFVTIAAYTVSSDVNFLDATVYVITNSLNFFKSTFASDACYGCYFYQDLASIPLEEYTGHQAGAQPLSVEGTFLMAVQYIVARVTGSQPNSPVNYEKPNDGNSPNVQSTSGPTGYVKTEPASIRRQRSAPSRPRRDSRPPKSRDLGDAGALASALFQEFLEFLKDRDNNGKFMRAYA